MMTQHNKTAALALAALIFTALRADAVVRLAPSLGGLAPAGIVPVRLPGVAMPLAPMPLEAPAWPILPIADMPLTPSVRLPGADVPVVSPDPVIETPTWPVLPMALGAAQNIAVQPINAPALETVKFLNRVLKDERTLRPTPVRLDAAFDARSIPENDQDVVEVQEPSRPAIDQPSRPLTLPEDDLLRELGF